MAKKPLSLTTSAVLVQAIAIKGLATPGNDIPFELLIVVTDSAKGFALQALVKSNFSIIYHSSAPGQTCGFTNNIVSFSSIGNGAYRIKLKPKNCNWVAGEHLMQIIVSAPLDQVRP